MKNVITQLELELAAVAKAAGLRGTAKEGELTLRKSFVPVASDFGDQLETFAKYLCSYSELYKEHRIWDQFCAAVGKTIGRSKRTIYRMVAEHKSWRKLQLLDRATAKEKMGKKKLPTKQRQRVLGRLSELAKIQGPSKTRKESEARFERALKEVEREGTDNEPEYVPKPTRRATPQWREKNRNDALELFLTVPAEGRDEEVMQYLRSIAAYYFPGKVLMLVDATADKEAPTIEFQKEARAS